MSSVWTRLEPHLPQVQSPSQYIGGEWNSSRKDDAEVKVAIAFHDCYKIGMAHLGIQIFYGMINARPDALCERVFLPWPDLEDRMRADGIPLFSLDSHRPVREFDILGISLQSELGYTNVLNMLELAGLPVYSKDRGPEFPLVVGGGVNASYPEPLADFFDVMILGDGEETVPLLIDLVKDLKNDRDGLLKAIAEKVPGAYVPRHYTWTHNPDGTLASFTGPVVHKAVVPSLEDAYFPHKPIVPFGEVVHDRINLEIMRGCPHRCRFCHAVSFKNKLRFRPVDQLVQQAEAIYAATGYDEIALSSLSSGDYPHIHELMTRLNARFKQRRVSVSLPSLRVDERLPELPALMTSVRKGGFTIAPEGGSEEFREIIRKPIKDVDLIATVKAAFKEGWNHVKMYFMVGFPMEKDADVNAIIETAKRVSLAGKDVTGRKADVNITISPLIPKPHTPFQFCGQREVSYVQDVERRLGSLARGTRIHLKAHDPRKSYIEGVFARGDRRLGAALVEARKQGSRYDEWNEFFDYERWLRVFEKVGVDPDFYARRECTVSEVLPWDHLDVGRPKQTLWTDYQAALQQARDREIKNAEKAS
ncbi:MAG TPA: TIGR03960 family B12-binding radical SAM protein [Planctomycetota bacterium]|nr:TIGR03960 family B12-binding radical SAM protein [Planctomycetota bacterium]